VVKRRGREVNLTPLSGAEIKNQWNTLLSPLYTFMARTGKTAPFNLLLFTYFPRRKCALVYLYNYYGMGSTRLPLQLLWYG